MNHIEQASRLAHAAVQNDQQQEWPSAMDLYIRAAELLADGIRSGRYPESEAAMRKSMESYIIRAEAIKQISSGNAPLLPVPPSSSSSAGVMVQSSSPLSTRRSGEIQQQQQQQGGDPSLLRVGLEAVKMVNDKGGRIVLDGLKSAQELNEKHQLTTKAAAAASAAAAAASRAAQAAKESNEKYKITEKAATIATATVTAISDLNAKHRVTERVGAAALSALDWTTQKAQQYLSNRDNGAAAVAAAPEAAAIGAAPGGGGGAGVSSKPPAFQ